ncbi:MAG: hypothetical protein AAF721_22665 [Myxococcota bacterium]
MGLFTAGAKHYDRPSTRRSSVEQGELVQRLVALPLAALEAIVYDFELPLRLGRLTVVQAAHRILEVLPAERWPDLVHWLDTRGASGAEELPDMVGDASDMLGDDPGDPLRSGTGNSGLESPRTANGGSRRNGEARRNGGGPEPIARRFQLHFIADGEKRQQALPPSSAVTIEAFIGPVVDGAHAAPGPINEDDLQFEEDRAEIDVVLYIKEGAEAGVWSRRLHVPRAGASDTVTFEIVTLDGAPLRAVVELHHRGRILQSMQIRASVDAEDFGRIQITWLEVSRAPGGLGERSGFDAALSETEGGLLFTGSAEETQPGVTVAPLGIETGAMGGLFAKLDAVLAGLPGSSRVVASEEDGVPPTVVFGRPSAAPDAAATTNPLRSNATDAALHELATQGYFLYRKILARGDDAVDLRARFNKARRLQLASAVQGDVLPIELCYDLNQPHPDAKLCAGAEAALQTGTCADGCGHDGKAICPLGFWGLRMVIERQIKTVSGQGDFVLSTATDTRQRRIRPLNAALFAASSRVDNQVAGGRQLVQEACEELAAQHGGMAKRADTWDRWRAGVDVLEPRLLVILPHVEQPRADAPEPKPPLKLEIGDGQLLEIDQLRKTDVLHVPSGVDEVTYSGYGNVVLLIGCETSRQRTYEQVIEQFQQNGAKVIFATLNRVMGRHAAPLAAELVRSFKDNADLGVGEHLLSFRRAMMLQGYPSAMGIVGFGDADWTVG